MKVALFGGTGFIGSYTVDELLTAGHEPRLMVRSGAEAGTLQAKNCTVITGDVNDDRSVRDTLADCEAAVYSIGILREHPARGVTFDALQRAAAVRVIEMAREAGVRRFVMMSANGVETRSNEYQSSKLDAERCLAAARLAGTVLRPSVVFGDPRGRNEFCTQLRDQLIASPLPAPMFFDGLRPSQAGRFRMSPVHVADVARVLVRALEHNTSDFEVLPLCGPEPLEWREIIRRIAAAVGRRKLTLPAPALPLRLLAKVLQSHEWFPLTADQLDMLLAGNTGDSSDVFARFGIDPIPFDTPNLAYLQS